MRRIWPIALSAICGIVLGAGLILLLRPNTAVPVNMHSALGSEEPEGHEQLYTAAVHVAKAIYTSDFAELSAWVHPQRGCLFAPFSTVDRQKCLTFTSSQILAMGSDKTEYAWGVLDASENPLMTSGEFFRDVLQIRDFSIAPGVGFDTVLRVGNSAENIQSEYPDCRIVDLYYPGAGKDPAGADWASLKLAFAESDGELKLVAVVRSVYTEQ